MSRRIASILNESSICCYKFFLMFSGYQNIAEFFNLKFSLKSLFPFGTDYTWLSSELGAEGCSFSSFLFLGLLCWSNGWERRERCFLSWLPLVSSLSSPTVVMIAPHLAISFPKHRSYLSQYNLIPNQFWAGPT